MYDGAALGLTVWFNKWFNVVRRKLGLNYWSISSVLKRNVKKAVNFINSYEHYIAKHASKKDCQGVICDISHSPVIKMVEE